MLIDVHDNAILYNQLSRWSGVEEALQINPRRSCRYSFSPETALRWGPAQETHPSIQGFLLPFDPAKKARTPQCANEMQTGFKYRCIHFSAWGMYPFYYAHLTISSAVQVCGYVPRGYYRLYLFPQLQICFVPPAILSYIIHYFQKYHNSSAEAWFLSHADRYLLTSPLNWHNLSTSMTVSNHRHRMRKSLAKKLIHHWHFKQRQSLAGSQSSLRFNLKFSKLRSGPSASHTSYKDYEKIVRPCNRRSRAEGLSRCFWDLLSK